MLVRVAVVYVSLLLLIASVYGIPALIPRMYMHASYMYEI